MPGKESSTEQNVSFDDLNNPYQYDASMEHDMTRCLIDTDETTLENFFRRPIKLATYTWNIASTPDFSEIFDPWSQFFNNRRVINRICNYTWLRCDLHVKFVVNGNGFYYGRMMATYLPYADMDALTTRRSLIFSDVIQASQQPHIFIDPTTSSGGDLVLPFFWHQNYLSIHDVDWALMGEVWMRQLNPLRHANGITNVPINISVYVWAENVQLSGLTSVNATTIIPQMGDENVEARTGVISGVASVVATAAGALSSVPTLRPYALATQTAATGISRLAKLFGYSRAIDISSPMQMVPRATCNLAVTDAPDTSIKLTVDSLQELTVDPRIACVETEDPLTIRSISNRESYLTKFVWQQTANFETMLWNCHVTPMLWNEYTSAGVTEFRFPACALAVLPFKYWNGTMKFRFQIAASAFHKGRLRVVYDPLFCDGNEYNVNYSQVIDIAEEKDFTIAIGPCQKDSLMTMARPGIDAVTELYSTTPYSAYFPGNGTIAVFVVNELTLPAPDVTAEIEINVYVSCDDDLEVFVPYDHHTNFSFFAQSGTLRADGETTSQFHSPEQNTTYRLGVSKKVNPNLNKVFTGESILSLRQMLKRYALHSTTAVGASAVPAVHRRRARIFPYLRGKAPSAVDTSTSGAYNYANTLLLHLVVNMFSGFRGSIRYKLIATTGGTAGSAFPSLTVERTHSDDGFSVNATLYDESSENFRNATAVNRFLKPTGAQGAGVQCLGVNGALEFEVPYYDPSRFFAGKISNWTANGIFGGGTACYNEYIMCQMNSKTFVDRYVSVGEDFQVYFWTGMPRLFYTPTDPLPV